MKKVMSLLFVASMITLAACGGKKEEAATTDSTAAMVDTSAAMVDSAAAMVDSAATAVDSTKK